MWDTYALARFNNMVRQLVEIVGIGAQCVDKRFETTLIAFVILEVPAKCICQVINRFVEIAARLMNPSGGELPQAIP